MPANNGYYVYQAADKAVVAWKDGLTEEFDPLSYERTPAQKAVLYSTARREKWLRANAKARALFKQAQSLPCVHPGEDWMEMGLGVTIDRRLGQLKIVEIKVRLAHGDALGAANSALDLLEMRINENHRHAFWGPGFVRVTMAQVYPSFSNAVSRMGDASARQTEKRLQQIDSKRDDLPLALSDLRNYSLAYVRAVLQKNDRVQATRWQYAFIEQTSHSDPPTPRQQLSLYFLPKRVYLAELQNLADGATKEIRLPYKALSELPETAFYIQVYKESVQTLLHNEAANRVTLDCMRVELALRRYFLAKGRYPSQLKELVPEFLPAIPIDYFSQKGDPLVYKRKENGYNLYGVGPDQKDDGGKHVDGGGFGGGISVYPNSKGDFVPSINR